MTLYFKPLIISDMYSSLRRTQVINTIEVHQQDRCFLPLYEEFQKHQLS